MKKLFYSLLFTACVTPLFAQSFFTIKDRQLYDPNGNKFIVKGVNYLSALFVPATSGNSPMYPVRSGSYYSSNTFTCTTPAGCLNDIAYDFNYISTTLRCNTIRLWLGNVNLTNYPCSNATDFTYDVSDPSVWPAPGYHTITSGNDLTFLVPYYQQVIDLAAGYGLHVILVLPGIGASCQGNTAIQNTYNAFLAATAAGLAGSTNLIAYDEWNEPQFYDADPNFTKQDVCNMTKNWYNILKANDRNHLVTVGLSALGLGVDAFQWSVDAYKADFYAFHIYPNLNLQTHIAYDMQGQPYTVLDQNLDYGNLQVYNERYNAAIAWLQNTTSLPWLIGETGFRANPNPNTNSALLDDGTLIQQSQFLTHAYTQTIQAGGMGTVWWQYSDVAWNPPGDPSVDFFGLVDRTNGNVKLAGNTLKNFNSYAVSGQPTGYPGNYQNSTVITGKVLDLATQQPIKNAVINGHHLQFNPNTGNIDYLYPVQTLTDANGNFNLTSVTPDASSGFPDPLTTAVNSLGLSAIGYDLASCDAYFNSNHVCAGKTFSLNIAANYNVEPNPAQYLATNNDALVSSPNDLNLSDFKVYFAGGGTVYEHEFTAQREIEILPGASTESYVEPNAEAAFYISPVDVNCSDLYNGYGNPQRVANNSSTLLGADENQQMSVSLAKTVYLQPEGAVLKIYPNPAQDLLLIDSQKSINLVMVSNMYGAIVAEFNAQGANRSQVDMSAFAPGTYLVKTVYSDNSISYTQIIKQ